MKHLVLSKIIIVCLFTPFSLWAEEADFVEILKAHIAPSEVESFDYQLLKESESEKFGLVQATMKNMRTQTDDPLNRYYVVSRVTSTAFIAANNYNVEFVGAGPSCSVGTGGCSPGFDRYKHEYLDIKSSDFEFFKDPDGYEYLKNDTLAKFTKEYTGQNPGQDPNMPEFKLATLNMCGGLFYEDLDIPNRDELTEEAITKRYIEAHLFPTNKAVANFFGHIKNRDGHIQRGVEPNTNPDCLQHSRFGSNDYLPLQTKDLGDEEASAHPLRLFNINEPLNLKNIITDLSGGEAGTQTYTTEEIEQSEILNFSLYTPKPRFQIQLNLDYPDQPSLMVLVEKTHGLANREDRFTFMSERSNVFLPVAQLHLPMGTNVQAVNMALWSGGSRFKTWVFEIQTTDKVYYAEVQFVQIINARTKQSIAKLNSIIVPIARILNPLFEYEFGRDANPEQLPYR